MLDCIQRTLCICSILTIMHGYVDVSSCVHDTDSSYILTRFKYQLCSYMTGSVIMFPNKEPVADAEFLEGGFWYITACKILEATPTFD